METKQQAEIRLIAAEADRAEVALARERDERDREVHDAAQHTYQFFDVVDRDTVADCMAECNYWSYRDPGCDITVMFDTPGGGVLAGMHLYDFLGELKRRGHRVVTGTRGAAASIGAVLLQAGDHRTMGAESYLLFHPVAVLIGSDDSELSGQFELAQMVDGRIMSLLVERSHMALTDVQAGMSRESWWVNATEALTLGLVDEIR
jgi:ATP-dependent protease ClpP protease subunit